MFIQTANPGPGTYGELKSSETASSSFSKKGSGGFVSKVSVNYLLWINNINYHYIIIQRVLIRIIGQF